MNDQQEHEVIRSRYTEEDLKAIKRLRSYYLRNFRNGESDDCFKIWIEDGLRALEKPSELSD